MPVSKEDRQAYKEGRENAEQSILHFHMFGALHPQADAREGSEKEAYIKGRTGEQLDED